MRGETVGLRALEPEDVSVLYRWENDPQVWRVSGTLAPFSRHALARFIEEQQLDIYATRQQRLVIETVAGGVAVGAVDLFDFDPLHGRAGVGILVYGSEDRGRGYAGEALDLLAEYAFGVLGLHQLYCNILSDNAVSLALFEGRGFVRCGLKREWVRSGEGFADEYLLQRLRDPVR